MQQTAQSFTPNARTVSVAHTHTHMHTHKFRDTRDGHLPTQWDAFCTGKTMLKYWHSESREKPKARERTHKPSQRDRNEIIFFWSANNRDNELYVLIIDDVFSSGVLDVRLKRKNNADRYYMRKYDNH